MLNSFYTQYVKNLPADAPNYLQDILVTYTMKRLDVVLKQMEPMESDAFYVRQFFFQSLYKVKSLQQNYETIRATLAQYPRLFVDNLDLVFKLSYGRT